MASVTKINVKKIKREEATKNILLVLFRTILIVGLSFVILFPIISAFIPAITDYSYLGEPNSIWFPIKTSLFNFRFASTMIEYKKTLPYTIMFALSIAIIQVSLALFVGYGFAMMRSKFKKLLFALVILTIIVPAQALAVPQFLYFSKMKIIGKVSSIYLLAVFSMGLKSGLFIYLFKQFFEGLPKELEEAATIDGCSYLGVFFRVMLPNAGAMILTVFVFSFVWNFGDTYYTTFFAEKANLLAPKIQDTIFYDRKIQGMFAGITFLKPTEMPSLFPGAIRSATLILYIFPLVIFYLIIQRKFVQGFERSGITGQ